MNNKNPCGQCTDDYWKGYSICTKCGRSLFK